MNIKQVKPFYKLFSLIGVVIVLNACSSEEASPWAKSESPWDQRRSENVEAAAPAADTYKADLEMPADNVDEVELSYQTESVESFTPEETIEAPTEELAVMEETISGDTTIMDQPADYYTMQLMASVDIDRVIRFAEANQLSTQYLVATERDGVIWHVLLLDVYPDYSSAVAARDEIAPSLKNAPWIRKVGSVQKLVR
ncbi:hypothetical protein MNBD_GAMMA08-1523 [hydrothermal vent metagenome]|uniref:SPOR domain-containing protein n=1 Tax=hydrothermal vent metagenome TaxID=652676 RepID=A0A3B0YIH8_9ZZZZ